MAEHIEWLYVVRCSNHQLKTMLQRLIECLVYTSYNRKDIIGVTLSVMAPENDTKQISYLEGCRPPPSTSIVVTGLMSF